MREGEKIYIVSADLFGAHWQCRVSAPSAAGAVIAAFGVPRFSGYYDRENDALDVTALNGSCGFNAKVRPLIAAVIDNVDFTDNGNSRKGAGK